MSVRENTRRIGCAWRDGHDTCAFLTAEDSCARGVHGMLLRARSESQEEHHESHRTARGHNGRGDGGCRGARRMQLESSSDACRGYDGFRRGRIWRPGQYDIIRRSTRRNQRSGYDHGERFTFGVDTNRHSRVPERGKQRRGDHGEAGGEPGDHAQVKAFARKVATQQTALLHKTNELASQLKLNVASATNSDVQDRAQNAKNRITD